MAKQDFKKTKEVITQDETETIEQVLQKTKTEDKEVTTNTEVTSTKTFKPIFPEDMTPDMKLKDEKPVKDKEIQVTPSGIKVLIKSSSCKEIVGKIGEVVEERDGNTVVLVGANRYLIVNSSLEKV